MSWLTPISRSIPHAWKVDLQATRRHWRDRRSGTWRSFATAGSTIVSADWRTQIKLSQEIKPCAHAANKFHNLATAIQQLTPVIVEPEQIFSFWHSVGPPKTKYGYRPSRALINNQLKAVVGGGLCQLSGLIYLLALHTDFEILERYCHSRDIYTDETRFAPLGSDATVVYGYKDLRIKNQTKTPIRFQFELSKTHITTAMMAVDTIPIYEVQFLIHDQGNHKSVRTIRHKRHSLHPEQCHVSVYNV